MQRSTGIRFLAMNSETGKKTMLIELCPGVLPLLAPLLRKSMKIALKVKGKVKCVHFYWTYISPLSVICNVPIEKSEHQCIKNVSYKDHLNAMLCSVLWQDGTDVDEHQVLLDKDSYLWSFLDTCRCPCDDIRRSSCPRSPAHVTSVTRQACDRCQC